MVKVGDIVGRRSYNCDIVFKVVYIDKQAAVLRGVSTRLEATAPISDLVPINKDEQEKQRREHIRYVRDRGANIARMHALKRERVTRDNAQVQVQAGRILHLDGDIHYVEECQAFYASLGVPARCLYVPEKAQSSVVQELCQNYGANVVVVTGHDGRFKSHPHQDSLAYYHNSQAFCASVEALRSTRPDKDDLAIVAGACQSYYEALINRGSNFASSPGRILIDIFDPCIVAVHLATTGVQNFLEPEGIVNATKGKSLGMGGVESQGKARALFPGLKWEEKVSQ